MPTRRSRSHWSTATGTLRTLRGFFLGIPDPESCDRTCSRKACIFEAEELRKPEKKPQARSNSSPESCSV